MSNRIVKPNPYTIKIFLPDGDPEGLQIVSKSNWTGVGVVFSRARFKSAMQRDEINRTGVYILQGESESGGQPTIYIGEGDPIVGRLRIHHAQKDFWNRGVFFVSADGSLNKAHVKYLESRLIQLAQEARQAKLDNTGGSNLPTLSESETADVESFLRDVLAILPLVGLNLFSASDSNSDVSWPLQIARGGINAKGRESSGGFTVARGSEMTVNETPSIPHSISNLREDLVGQGVVLLRDDHFVVQQDYEFGSPSAAAAVLLGRSANGREEWRTVDGVTLKQLQEQEAEEPDEEE